VKCKNGFNKQAQTYINAKHFGKSLALEPQPQPSISNIEMTSNRHFFVTITRMTMLKQIIKALEASWSGDTAYNKSDWTPENPARGQCVVSSLVVQDYLGGDLVKCAVDAENLQESHYFNKLDDGTMLDVTGKQYTFPVNFRLVPVSHEGFESIRDKRLSDDDTRLRYKILKSRVDSFLPQSKESAPS